MKARALTLTVFIILFLLLHILVPGHRQYAETPFERITWEDRIGGASNPIVASQLNFVEAIAGSKAPRDILDRLTLLNVKYYGMDSLCYIGQILVDEELEMELIALFDTLYRTRFPIARMVPVSEYQWSDDSSMIRNNTSAFNYRVVKGTSVLSKHCYGRALDINPFTNPYISRSGKISPPGASYDPLQPGALSDTSLAVRFLKDRGWKWGGDWRSIKDYQHFEKSLR